MVGKISTTNILEQSNNEIRRSNRVVGIFPNLESYIRLITMYMIKYTEELVNITDIPEQAIGPKHTCKSGATARCP